MAKKNVWPTTGLIIFSQCSGFFSRDCCGRKAGAAAEVNARGRRRVVAEYRLFDAACGALPEPRLAVHEFDFFASQQLGARCLCDFALLVPHLEMDEHLVVVLAAGVDLGNHVDAVHCSQVETLDHVVNLFARRALEYTRDANAGFVGLGLVVAGLVVARLVDFIWLVVAGAGE